MSRMVETQAWDLSVRLFHWTLVAAILFCWLSAELGGNWMDWHTKSGYLVAGLVVFRLLWGFFGSWTARFTSFVRSPKTVINYLKSNDDHHWVSHNPAGGYGVLTLIGLVALQAGTGLFTNDDIFIEGPLAFLISYDLQMAVTGIHKTLFNVLLAVIALHVAAVIFHQKFKGEKLVQAMIHGRKAVPETKKRALVIPKGALLFSLLIGASITTALLYMG